MIRRNGARWSVEDEGSYRLVTGSSLLTVVAKWRRHEGLLHPRSCRATTLQHMHTDTTLYQRACQHVESHAVLRADTQPDHHDFSCHLPQIPLQLLPNTLPRLISNLAKHTRSRIPRVARSREVSPVPVPMARRRGRQWCLGCRRTMGDGRLGREEDGAGGRVERSLGRHGEESLVGVVIQPRAVSGATLTLGLWGTVQSRTARLNRGDRHAIETSTHDQTCLLTASSSVMISNHAVLKLLLRWCSKCET
jgi:hypothetical protein